MYNFLFKFIIYFFFYKIKVAAFIMYDLPDEAYATIIQHLKVDRMLVSDTFLKDDLFNLNIEIETYRAMFKMDYKR